MSGTDLERLAHVAPFGMRLSDAGTGRPIVDGITVRLVPPSGPPTMALRTAAGVFAAHGLAGLRGWERRDVTPEGAVEATAIEPVEFRIEVRDGTGSYHPFSLRADLPSDGLVTADLHRAGASPPDATYDAIPLFSLPARAIPVSTAVVRARLVHADDHSPAAYAAIDVVPAPGVDAVRGIADRRGEVVVVFPYPPPPGLAGSPPVGAKRALAETVWRVTFQASLPRHDPRPGTDELPDLDMFLDQVPTTLTAAGSPSHELHEETLEYGRELVLRSSTGDPALLVGA